MTETTHTRSRNASLGGLVLQLVAFGGTLAVSFASQSQATFHLAFYVLGGVPIWFVALLVFHQRGLAALEALDLEELRREKQVGGGGEALFDEEGGAGFRVAETRLRWMQRWLVPAFGLLSAAYLAAVGVYLWRRLAISGLAIGAGPWPELSNVAVAMVVLAIVMLGLFLLSRYTSGMGRAAEWQLLRGCGSYMLGNALVITGVLVCLGVHHYAIAPAWEQALAFAIPVVMIVLAIETVINLVLDIYRPRVPGAEPRAAFDSRLLGLLAEPGGIAHSIAEAINYQFGFQVSQTWFYKLLVRTFVPLIAVGALSLWVLTCVVVVQPYEHVIVERFGRQLNAQAPLAPGAHFKLPWPIDVARTYNTGRLHQIFVGFERFDAVPEIKEGESLVLLWTDTKHYDMRHFDFLICPTRSPAEQVPDAPQDEEIERDQFDEQPVHMIRMDVAFQYRICAELLERYTQAMENPHRVLLDAAWEEVGRFNASSTIDELLGHELSRVGELLRERINERVANVGLEVVYVGVTNIHPEKSVAEAYRNVVRAEQEKVAAIRGARVTENQRLSSVAGEASRARMLADAVERARHATERENTALETLHELDPAQLEHWAGRLAELDPLFRARIDRAARRDRVLERKLRIERDFELGLGRTFDERVRARQVAEQAEQEAEAAAAALAEGLAPLRQEMLQQLDPGPEQTQALIDLAAARVARLVWEQKLETGFTQRRLAGEAARRLATALADRWQREMTAAGELARVENERTAFRAAPEVYKARHLMEVLVDGLKDARKFFLAFDPGERLVRVRFVAEDEAQTDITRLRPARQ